VFICVNLCPDSFLILFSPFPPFSLISFVFLCASVSKIRSLFYDYKGEDGKNKGLLDSSA